MKLMDTKHEVINQLDPEKVECNWCKRMISKTYSERCALGPYFICNDLLGDECRRIHNEWIQKRYAMSVK